MEHSRCGDCVWWTHDSQTPDGFGRCMYMINNMPKIPNWFDSNLCKISAITHETLGKDCQTFNQRFETRK